MKEILENIVEETPENVAEEVVEESLYDKLIGLKAEVNQMKRMIEENIRLIAEGDDVEGRTYLKQHLENEVRKKQSEIIQLENNL